MKNSLAITIIVCLALFGWIYWQTGQQQEHYDSVAPQAIETILSDVSQWRAEPLKRHLSEQAAAVISDQQLSTLTAQYRPLGAFKAVKVLEFSRLAAAFSLFSSPKANYSGTAEFEQAEAHFTITLVQQAGQFKIYNLNISPAASTEL